MEKQLERALAEIERLRKQLEEALRANKRSAAPFSKGEPKSDPKPPGRKTGAAYGERATRPVPSRVDERIHVPLPPRCPHCHGPVILKDTQPQYQEDIVRMPQPDQSSSPINRPTSESTRCGGTMPDQSRCPMFEQRESIGRLSRSRPSA